MSTKNQVATRGLFENFFYSIIKKGMEKVDVQINGPDPSDIQVHSNQTYYRFFKYFMGDRKQAGESYMDGDWSAEDLVGFIEKCLRSGDAFNRRNLFITKIQNIPILFFNMQDKLSSQRHISSHYDIGNDLFELMLDQTLNYTCAYWEQKSPLLDPSFDFKNMNSQLYNNKECETLYEAQMNKMLLIARKLHLKPGMRVLDTGCGWGFLTKFLAINFDVHVLGVTISKEQNRFAIENFTKFDELNFLRIPALQSKGTGTFELRLQDYRDVTGQYDRIVSVGMCEHIGSQNYAEYFDNTRRSLKDDGIFLLHTIGIHYHKIPQADAWYNKYIFPGAMIPYHTQLIDAFYGKFIIEDWQNLGYNYYRTLMAWNDNFQKSWPQLEARYGERFKRMWEYYLLSSAAVFKARKLNLWHIILSKKGVAGGYISVR